MVTFMTGVYDLHMTRFNWVRPNCFCFKYMLWNLITEIHRQEVFNDLKFLIYSIEFFIL